MKSIVSLTSVSKAYGNKTLFENLNLSIQQGDQVAIIGSNGAGKSTLLKIIGQIEQPDSGDIHIQKNLNVSYIPQSPKFKENQKLVDIFPNPPQDDFSSIHRALSLCGFEDFNQKTHELSGGWIKRLAIALALHNQPDLIILDEPSNHMDWQSIDWLKRFLMGWQGTFILVSHDRHLLNSCTTRTIEIGRSFKNGNLSFNLPYQDFLKKRQDYFLELSNQKNSLKNKSSREDKWLKAGVKARTTKSKHRAEKAYELFDQLDEVNQKLKSSQKSIEIGIETGSVKAKKIIELKGIEKSFGANTLFTNLSFKIDNSSKLAILGHNGSGKSTLVNIITQSIKADQGELFIRDNLDILHFDQQKETLPEEETVFEYLGDGNDYVTFFDNSIHVASYAAKFLFSTNHYHLKIKHLSGGEKARLQLARVLLGKADLLILDEPTNDLDIQTIESLETVLSESNLPLILISHDQTFVENTCNQFLALQQGNKPVFYASVDQWLKRSKANPERPSEKDPENSPLPKKEKKKKAMSYKDKQELKTIEVDILKQEELLDTLNAKITEETAMEDLQKLSKEIADLSLKIQKMYARWQELEDLSQK